MRERIGLGCPLIQRNPRSRLREQGVVRELATYSFDLRHHDPLFNLLPHNLDFTQQIVVILPQIRSFDRHEPGHLSCVLEAWEIRSLLSDGGPFESVAIISTGSSDSGVGWKIYQSEQREIDQRRVKRRRDESEIRTRRSEKKGGHTQIVASRNYFSQAYPS